jgi:flagellar hook-associated protein 3 FlgL
MAINTIGGSNASLLTPLLNLRNQLDELQAQLATGKKATTYAGMGVDRGFAIGLRAQINAIDGFSDTIINVNTRIQITNTTLRRINDIRSEVQHAASSPTLTLNNTGQTIGQTTAQGQFAELVEALNVQAGDRFLFSGLATDTSPVAALSDILNGSGTSAGLKQVIAERLQADQGTGSGRVLITTPTATSVQIAEDAAPSPFGLKLGTVTSALTGATVTGPSGSPPAVSVDLGPTNPNDGETINYTFVLPDGSQESILLTASSANPPPAGSFAIGATSAATAANLQAAVTAAITKLSGTSLVAASALAASDNFFHSNPPLRVGTVPLSSATTLVSGAANTVSWYAGENGPTPARATAVARIDQAVTVQYGARANEEALRWQLQNIAAYVAVSTSPSNPNGAAQIQALSERVAANLAPQPGQQSIADIQADFAGAQTSMKAAADRLAETKTLTQTMLDSIEGVRTDEVTAQILTLQTNLQASYQTTSTLLQTSLLKYL